MKIRVIIPSFFNPEKYLNKLNTFDKVEVHHMDSATEPATVLSQVKLEYNESLNEAEADIAFLDEILDTSNASSQKDLEYILCIKNAYDLLMAEDELSFYLNLWVKQVTSEDYEIVRVSLSPSSINLSWLLLQYKTFKDRQNIEFIEIS